MRRVAVTGLGIACSLGSRLGDVLESLRAGRSGMVAAPELREWGLNCGVYAPVRGWSAENVARRSLRSMSQVAQYAVTAAIDALADAQLAADDLPKPRTSVVVGTEFSGINEVSRTEEILRTKKSPSRAGAGCLLKFMNSTCSGNLASYFGVNGRSYSLSSSFASGADNIGHGYELVRHGLADVCLAGSGEEAIWKQIGPYYHNWGGMPVDYNDRPTEACRPYDVDRKGFVLSEGAGVLILEEWDRAMRRGARIYAEIAGYGSSNDGNDLFRPSGEGLKRALTQGLAAAKELGVTRVDYVNTHGTGTPVGDEVEVSVLKSVFDGSPPWISSTKGLSGHAMGAAGAHEAVYTLLMLKHGFVAPTANLREVAPECAGVRHVQKLVEQPLGAAISFNVGLGGANSCLVFRNPKSDSSH